MAYTAATPNVTDRINDTQAPMKANFEAINTVVSLNHVTFDDPSGNQGKHKFVSFPEQAADPVTPADEVALYSKLSTLGALETELFLAREGAGDIVEFTSAGKAAAGWTRLPSGILIKWASGGITAGAGQTTYPWPVAGNIPVFADVFDCHVTTRTGGNQDKFVQLSGFSTTNVLLYGTYRTTNVVRQVNYNVIAIGI